MGFLLYISPQVTPNGEMISPLDLAHHRPYEVLVLARVPSEMEQAASEKRERPSEKQSVASEEREQPSETEHAASEWREQPSERQHAASEEREQPSERQPVASEERNQPSERRPVTSDDREQPFGAQDIASVSHWQLPKYFETILSLILTGMRAYCISFALRLCFLDADRSIHPGIFGVTVTSVIWRSWIGRLQPLIRGSLVGYRGIHLLAFCVGDGSVSPESAPCGPDGLAAWMLQPTATPTAPDNFVIVSVPGEHSRKPPLKSKAQKPR